MQDVINGVNISALKWSFGITNDTLEVPCDVLISSLGGSREFIKDLLLQLCCATNRKVAGSIPAGVSGFFIDTKSFRSHHGPGVDSASNRNEYQEYFLGVKAAGA